MEEKQVKGARFHELTKKRGVKSALAEHLGIPEELAKINMWKTRSVPAGYAPMVAAYLGCNPEEISANYKSAGAPIPAPRSNRDPGAAAAKDPYEQVLLHEYRNASPERRRAALAILIGEPPPQPEPPPSRETYMPPLENIPEVVAMAERATGHKGTERRLEDLGNPDGTDRRGPRQ